MAMVRSSAAVGAVGVAGAGHAPARPLLPRPPVRRSFDDPSYVVESTVPLRYAGGSFGVPKASEPLKLWQPANAKSVADAARSARVVGDMMFFSSPGGGSAPKMVQAMCHASA